MKLSKGISVVVEEVWRCLRERCGEKRESNVVRLGVGREREGKDGNKRKQQHEERASI